MAGEGCFSVTRKLPAFANGDVRHRFVFTIEVAERDRPLLESLQHSLDVGTVTDHRARRIHWQPTSKLLVTSLRAHRERVIPFMDRHLPDGEKRRQFERWVAQMNEQERAHPSRWGLGPSPCRITGCEDPVRGQGLCRRHYHQETGH